MLEPSINSRLLAFGGAKITGIGFKYRDIHFDEVENGWRLQMSDKGEILYDVSVSQSACGTDVPADSCFPNAEVADNFLLGVSQGGQWKPDTSRLCLLPETHEPWETVVTQCETHTHRFLDGLECRKVAADHVITMTHIPHSFGLHPVTTRLA